MSYYKISSVTKPLILSRIRPANQFAGLGGMNKSKCTGMLERGRWSHDYDSFPNNAEWHPFGCTMRAYDQSSTRQCLEHKTVYFLGDSTARTAFWALAAKLDPERAKNASLLAEKHADLVHKFGNATLLQFIWDPFLNATESTLALQSLYTQRQTPTLVATRVKAIIIGTGMWHARYLDDAYSEAYNSTLYHIQEILTLAHGNIAPFDTQVPFLFSPQQVYLIPPVYPDQYRVDHDRAATLTSDRLNDLHHIISKFQRLYRPYVAWNILDMTKNYVSAFGEDGLHVSGKVATLQANSLLNHFCARELNPTRPESFSDCCSGSWRPFWSTTRTLLVALSLIGIGMKHSSELCDKSARDSIRAFGTIIQVVAYCYAADRTPLIDKAAKIAEARLFIGSCMLFALAAILCRRHTRHVQVEELPRSGTEDPTRNCDSYVLLQREYTEEWKGWMQAVVLLYHYFGMSQVFWVYRIVRVLVGSYLFLSGYGHATYFLTTNDYSFRRTISVLFRLNLLPCLLSVAMNNPYDFYYFPGLASLWYLVTYVTLWRPTGERMRLRDVIARITTSAVLFRLCLTPSRVKPLISILNNIHGPNINLHEFVFRVRLDMIAPYIGMALATAIHTTSQRTPGVICSHYAKNTHWQWVCGISSLIVIVCYFALTGAFADKYAYNIWHPWLSMIPILSYTCFRNSTPYVASSVSWISIPLGKCSLETFVLQYHIWLAADTKSLLKLGVIDVPRLSGRNTLSSLAFWLETAIVSVVFVCTAHECAKATNVLQRCFIGDTEVHVKATDVALPLQTDERGLGWFFLSKISQASNRLIIKTVVSLILLWFFRNL